MFKRSLTSISLLAAALAPMAAAASENTTTPVAGSSSGVNPVMIGLAVLSAVLCFAIIVLAGVLRSLASAYRDKMRKQVNNTALKAVALLIALGIPALAAHAADIPSEAAAAPASVDIAGMPAFQFYVLMGLVIFELVITLALVGFIRMMVRLIVADPELSASEAGAEALQKVKRIPFWDRLNKSVDVEKEEDIMLDHDYDGIRELDNSLPPWWKYGFYFTILIAVVYIWYYHIGGGGPSSYEEYAAEVRSGEEAKAAYLAQSANNVDENNVKMGDAASIGAGQVLFQSTCAACHAKDGGGGVGPNLTDNYWLHKGGVADVFKSIKYGWPDKGMKSWKDDFSPRQLADLTSYIKSLQGSKPANPKAQQGELYEETGEPGKQEGTTTVAAQ